MLRNHLDLLNLWFLPQFLPLQKSQETSSFFSLWSFFSPKKNQQKKRLQCCNLTNVPGAPWSPRCHSKVRTTMSPHCGSYDRGAVEMILGEKIKSSMFYINTVYYNLIIIKNTLWWDGSTASPTQWTLVWARSRSWWWTGCVLSCSLVCRRPWGRKESDTTEWLNGTDDFKAHEIFANQVFLDALIGRFSTGILWCTFA